MPKVGTGSEDAGQDYVITETLKRQDYGSVLSYPAAPGRGPELPSSPSPLFAPTHRHPVRVFLPNLFTFFFPILEGVVLFVLELHDGAQDLGVPRTGPAARW